jgi:hypothetical protein
MKNDEVPNDESQNGLTQVIPRSAEESLFQTCPHGQLDPSADLGMTAIQQFFNEWS